MPVAVKRRLRKYAFPPDLEADAVKGVVQQAEVLAQEDDEAGIRIHIGRSGCAGEYGQRLDPMSADKAHARNLVVNVERRVRLWLPHPAELDGTGDRNCWKDSKLNFGAVLVSDLIENPAGQQPKASQVALIAKSTRAEAAASNLPY